MVESKFVRTTLGVVINAVAVSLVLGGCGGRGDTDGGKANDDAGPGFQYVDDGGSGSTLFIETDGELSTGETEGFRVIATDPNGQPLPFIRIFCESEHGIAILEPSRGGVAFEHTNQGGIMSGVLGGLTPGSYLLECRGPQGFNLVARTTLRVVGDVPPGFDGFPGAAGGNLGGGLLVEEPDSELLAIRQVNFVDVTGEVTPNGFIDLTGDNDCNDDGTTTDPEPFGFDNYVVTLINGLTEAVFVNSVTFTVDDGRNVTSTQQTAGLVVNPSSEVDVVGTFTEFNLGGEKTYAGTTSPVVLGTYNVTFTVEGETASGESVTVQQSASVTNGFINNCGG